MRDMDSQQATICNHTFGCNNLHCTNSNKYVLLGHFEFFLLALHGSADFSDFTTNVMVQAEAALELQRLRARLLDGLCPVKLRQSERVKRLAKRLARLEQNVGRASAFGN